MGSCAAPSAKGDDKFITTDYLQQCLAGYLIRSKSAESTEGGVHSGQGVLDSLVYSD
ncbi:TPA: hypothetical protein ACIYFY_005167 [Escherichia coli]